MRSDFSLNTVITDYQVCKTKPDRAIPVITVGPGFISHGLGMKTSLTPKSLVQQEQEQQQHQQVLKNAKGGVFISEGDIKTAFDFFDFEGKGVVTASTLRKRLRAFNRSLSVREARFLMNNKAGLTLEDLREVLLENEVVNFDPVAEAFKVYDPEGTGYVDIAILRRIFDNLGFGLRSDEDLNVLIDAADGDGDGRVNLEDFRGMCDSSNKANTEGARIKPQDSGCAQEKEFNNYSS